MAEPTPSTTAPEAAPPAEPAPTTEAPKAEETPAPAAPAAEEKKEAPELQNALTKKFTDAEWTALKAFRKELSAVFNEAYTEKEGDKTAPIVLWGVTLDPSKPETDAKVSVLLVKFLRARNLNVAAAKDMLIATLRWRDEFGVEAAIKEEHADVFANSGHIYGKDKQGRPVVYNIYGGGQDLKAVFSDVKRFLRWRVALMEKSIALLDFENVDQTVQVHDYEGVSMSSRDANSKQAASEASSIFSSHYPEMLYKKFFINVPTYLTWIFWLFKPILPAATLSKMTVVGTGAHTIGAALLPIVDAKELPKRYGGEAEAF